MSYSLENELKNNLPNTIKKYNLNYKFSYNNNNLLYYLVTYDKNGNWIDFFEKQFHPNELKIMIKQIDECGNNIFHHAAQNVYNFSILDFLKKYVEEEDFWRRKNKIGENPYRVAEYWSKKWAEEMEQYLYNVKN